MNSHPVLSPFNQLMAIVDKYNSVGSKRSLFDQNSKIVRWTIKAKAEQMFATGLNEVQAGESIMTAINSIPFETISRLEREMIGKIIYACPSYLHYFNGAMHGYLQNYFLTSFQDNEALEVEDHIIIDTLPDAQIHQFVNETYKKFIIPIAQKTEVYRSDEYKKYFSNILIRYSNYLNDNEIANVAKTLCYLFSKNVQAVRHGNPPKHTFHIFDHLIKLMPRLSAQQLRIFYEVIPKSLSLEVSKKQVVIPLFRFFQHLKGLPAAKDITFNAGNELIHNYLRYYNNSKINHDYIDIIREFYQGASLETMILFVEVMLDNLEYDVHSRFKTFNSVINPSELYQGEFGGRVNEDLMVDGYIALAKLFDILPQSATAAITRKYTTFYPSDWHWISIHFSPLELSLDVFSPVIPNEIMAEKFETDLTAYQQGFLNDREIIPNQLELLSHYLPLLNSEKRTQLIILLLAETTNNDPQFRQEAFDGLLRNFVYFKAFASPEIVQNFFDTINLDPFSLARQILIVDPTPIGTEKQREELLDAVLNEGRREQFFESLKRANYSITSTTNKYPAICAILCERLQNICENPTAKINNGLLPILNNILSLLFLKNDKNSNWELDDSSKLLLTRFALISRLLNPNSFINLQLYLTFTTGILRICHRIGEGELIQRYINSYLNTLNNPQLHTNVTKPFNDKLKSAVQLIVEDSVQLYKKDSSRELQTSIMKFFLNCISDDSLNDPVFKMADFIIDSSKKTSEFIDICKISITAMNNKVANSAILNEHSANVLRKRNNLFEILIIFFPLIKAADCLELCGLYKYSDATQKALYAIAIKSKERQQEIVNATDIPTDCAQIVIAYDKYVRPGLRLS
jgi:hypothetical protein